MTTFFMIREHPSRDLIMIQVDNTAIQLNGIQQLKLYKFFKEKFTDRGKQ